MSYKLEQSIVPPPGTDTTVACDFEISESSSKLPAFFPRKTKCTPAHPTMCRQSYSNKNELVSGLNAVMPTTHHLMADVLFILLIHESPW